MGKFFECFIIFSFTNKETGKRTMAWTDWIWAIVCPIIAYFIGSIPFSFLITKWRTGVDLRASGNKNVGGLNAMLQVGFGWGFLAGFLDYSKGLLCIVLALVLPFSDEAIFGEGLYYEMSWHKFIYIFVCMGVILGHNYPIFLNFEGGRGIAAIASFLVVTNPLLLLIFIFAMGIIAYITKYLRPSQFLALFVGIPAAFFLPIYPPWMYIHDLTGSFFLGLFVIGISLVILPKYVKSFIDMFKGKEYKVGRTGGVELAEEDKH